MPKSKPSKSKPTLNQFRKQVDRADQALLKALGARFRAVEGIGKIKRELGLPLYQKARWAEVVEDRVGRARTAGVDEAFTRKLLNLIHREAIRIQKKK